MFRRIAIKGAAGAGKDYLYEQLNNANPGNIWCRLAFADPMKEMARIMTGLTLEQIEMMKGGVVPEGTRDALPPSIRNETDAMLKGKMRKVLQFMGTELGRNIWAEENWVWNALRRVERLEASDVSGFYEGVVITDLRFKNEFDALEKEGFLLVNLTCPVEYQRIQPGSEAYQHPSERDLDDYIKAGKFHVTLNNDRKTSADELVEAIYEAWESHHHEKEEARRA